MQKLSLKGRLLLRAQSRKERRLVNRFVTRTISSNGSFSETASSVGGSEASSRYSSMSEKEILSDLSVDQEGQLQQTGSRWL